MQDLLRDWIPNVVKDWPVLQQSIGETLQMLLIAGSISFALGLLFGTALVVCRPDGILRCPALHLLLNKLIDLLRAIPFIILLFCLLPLTRLMVGTAIGVRGAIVPLVFGTTPFFSRQIEAALSQVDPGLVEAAQAMGSGSLEIILRLYWRESVAPIARGVAITLINLLGLTAMAGAVGAGGLGNFAYIYGQQRSHMDDIYVTVVILVLMVSVIQVIGNWIVKRNTH